MQWTVYHLLSIPAALNRAEEDHQEMEDLHLELVRLWEQHQGQGQALVQEQAQAQGQGQHQEQVQVQEVLALLPQEEVHHHLLRLVYFFKKALVEISRNRSPAL